MKLSKLWLVIGFPMAAAGLTGCYDDSGLWNAVDGIESRVITLEESLASLNGEISALKTVVGSIERGAVITSLVDTGDGYRCVLSDGQTFTLRHGADGKDGVSGADGNDAPVIGVKADESDGVYYWTITVDGRTEWLADADGNRMRVSGRDGVDGKDGSDGADGADGKDGNDGADGKDGIDGTSGLVPVIGVKDGYWTVDYGDGNGAVYVLDADGQKVAVGGQTVIAGLFSEVKPQDEEVVFTMADGTEFSLPRVDNFGIDIDTSDPLFEAGETRVYPLALTNVSDFYVSAVTEGWRAVVKNESLQVTAPTEFDEENRMADIRIVAVNRRHECRAFKLSVMIREIELRTLTFEDIDYKGSGNMLGIKDWSSLIDSEQYGGPLLYPTDNILYRWYDEGNTELASEFANKWEDYQFWGGGHALSNYTGVNLSEADFTTQLAVYYSDAQGNGGHAGSKNFCVHNGYMDVREGGLATNPNIPGFYFKDGVARVVREMYVTTTAYFVNCWINGNGLTSEAGPTDTFEIVAYGYDAEGNLLENELRFTLAKGDDITTSWKRFDLSALGKVSRIRFNLESTVDNGYGMSVPGYFAYDDVTVEF